MRCWRFETLSLADGQARRSGSADGIYLPTETSRGKRRSRCNPRTRGWHVRTRPITTMVRQLQRREALIQGAWFPSLPSRTRRSQSSNPKNPQSSSHLFFDPARPAGYGREILGVLLI